VDRHPSINLVETAPADEEVEQYGRRLGNTPLKNVTARSPYIQKHINRGGGIVTRRVVVAGLFGGVVIMVWMILVNGILGFNSRINMKRLSNERAVYEILKNDITEPGKYVCNPEGTPSGYPPNEPVFSILYGGMGHEAAGQNMLIQLPFFFIVPVVAAWMLSVTSKTVLASFPRKLAFIACIGLLFGVWGHLGNFGIGGYPLADTIALMVHDIVLWALVGLVLAWRMRPETETITQS
jgi:hypothetical protein